MKPLNQRQENILLSLKKLDFLNREQLRHMHRLGQVRNCNRILKGLEPFIYHFREAYSNVYYLSKDGREYVGSKKVLKKNSFVGHTLMRNDFYVYSGLPTNWKNEMKISDGEYTLICDVLFRSNGKYQFLEVDNTQKMIENRKKIEQYKGLYANKKLEDHLKHFPTINWLTTTELRRKQLTDLCDGLPCKVYTITDIR
jgi:hypothetical protein